MANANSHQIKIKFKWIGTPQNINNDNLLQYYQCFYSALGLSPRIPITVRHAAHNGAIEVHADESLTDELYKIYEPLALQRFRTFNIEPLPSGELSNLATISIRDPPLNTTSEQDLINIKKSIVLPNRFALNDVKRVSSGKGQSRPLYIEFANRRHAEYAASAGVFILNTFIPSTHITTFKHITAKQCYNCYKLESHPTRLCPQPFPSCSICREFHHFKNCPKVASQNRLDFYCRNCDTHGHKSIDRSARSG